MNFKTPWVATMLLALAPLCNAGLLGDPYGMKAACLQRQSRAYCALDAADMSDKLQDASRDTVEKAMRESGLGPADIAMIAGTGTGVISPMPGLGRLGSIGLMLLVGNGPPPSTHQGNRVFAWMPRDMAASPNEAIDVLEGLLHQHIREVFKDYAFEDVALYGPGNAPPTALHREALRGWALSGPGCAPAPCTLTHHSSYNFWSKPPAEGTAPEWLGGYKAWVFAKRSGLPLDSLWTGSVYDTPRYADRLSSLLPEWIFLSLSPESSRDQLVSNPGLRMPFVYNKGKPLLLVFPELEPPAGPASTADQGPVMKKE